MTRRVEMDAYEAAILHPELNLAPRLAAGWAALRSLLSDGAWHTREDCYVAMEESGDEGLAEGTATMLIRAGTRFGLLEPRRGRELRGIPPRHVSLYTHFRLAESEPASEPGRVNP